VQPDEVDRMTADSVQKLVSDACSICDFVVIDSPPLIDVADAVPFARAADEILLVSRVGNSHVRQMCDLGELLTRQEIVPTAVGLGLLAGRWPVVAMAAAAAIAIAIAMFKELAVAIVVFTVATFAAVLSLGGAATGAKGLGLLLVLAWVATVASRPRAGRGLF